MERVLDSANQSLNADESADATQARSAEELYENVALASAPLLVEIPIASGVDVYVFWGEAMREAIRAQAAAELGDRAYADIDEMFATEELDGAISCTPAVLRRHSSSEH